MNIRVALIIVTYNSFLVNPVLSTLVHHFFDYVTTLLLGSESTQQFSLAICSFSGDYSGSFNVGPHSVAWKRLGHNQRVARIHMQRPTNVTLSHNSEAVDVFVVIFDNSSSLSSAFQLTDKRIQDLSSFRKLILFIPNIANVLSAVMENPNSMNSTHWLCNCSVSSRQLLFVAIKGPSFDFKSNNREKFEVFDVYCIGKTLFVNKIPSIEGIWEVEKRRSDLKIVPIRFAVQPDPSLSIYTRWEVTNGNLKRASGLLLNEIEFFSHEMNFTIEVVVGTGWTEELPNGSLSGMGGQLLGGEADVILSISEFLPYRTKKLAFSIVIQLGRSHVYFKRSMTVLENLYLKPFESNLWMGAAILFGILVLVNFSVSRTFHRNVSPVSSAVEQPADWNLTWIIAIICQQGWHEVPREASRRITLLCGILPSMILYLLFSSSIVALFSVDVDVFKKMLDLPRHGFKLYALAISEASVDVLKEATQDTRIKQYVSDRAVAIAEARELLRHTTSAIVAIENDMYQMSRMFQDHSDKEFCSWVSDVQVPGSVWTAGMMFRKQDPIRDIFRFKMTAWQERGLRFRNQNSFKRQGHPHCVKPPTQVKHLTLSHVALSFQVYAVGFLGAVLLFLWEYILNLMR